MVLPNGAPPMVVSSSSKRCIENTSIYNLSKQLATHSINTNLFNKPTS